MADMVSDAEKDTETFVSWREFLGSPYAASLALVCLAVWLHAADSLIVATMLPAIVAEIGGIALVGWSVSLYEIGSIVAGAASALLTLRFGLRAPMSMAAALFGVGCILSAVSPTMPLLLAGRALQGIGGGGLVAEIRGRTPVSARLVELTFDRDGAALWEALYRVGRPVQYSHLEEDLELWSVQTLFAGRPWAAEMPSAGRPLSWRLVQRLRSRGVGLVSITHAAGLSATGDPAIDAALPLPERYEVPSSTVQAIRDTKQMGGRVIAVGTTVTRALEGAAAAHGGRLEPGAGVTDLVLDAHFEPRIVDGLLTGMHEPTESHYRLLEAFVERTVLDSAVAHAIEAGYRTHEFGDCTLVLTE